MRAPQLDDLRWLSDAVKGNKRKLTSLERYEREVRDGSGGAPSGAVIAVVPPDTHTLGLAPTPMPRARSPPQLTAKRLEWTPVHTADFWRESALAFEVGDFRLIKALAALLVDPACDDTTLAVALFDLGEFAVNHPQGRALLASLGVRPTVMALLKRDEDEVKQQALLACSKLLVTNWRYVGGGGANTPVAATAAAGAGR